MYILIDREQLAIVHKHSSVTILKLLGWLECTNFFSVVQIGSHKDLIADVLPTSLHRIYKNATGGDMNPYSSRLPHAIFEAAKRMPLSDVILEELETQCTYVKAGSPSTFKYRRGAELPDRTKTVYAPPPLKVPRIEADEKYTFVPTVTVQQQAEEAAAAGTTAANQAAPWQPKVIRPVADPTIPPWTRPKTSVVISEPAAGMAPRPWEIKK